MTDTGSDPSTFRVEFLDGRLVDMSFDADAARSLRTTLDRATTIVACPDCGDLTPITGGIPAREMPRCARCDDPMRGVVGVAEIERPETGDRRPETGDRRPETGDRKSREQGAGNE